MPLAFCLQTKIVNTEFSLRLVFLAITMLLLDSIKQPTLCASGTWLVCALTVHETVRIGLDN